MSADGGMSVTQRVLTEMAKLKVEQWRVDKVIPYDANPRKIGPEAVRKVAGSIERFGFNVPIVVDEAGVILAGHTRRAAALSLGLKVVPVIVRAGLTEAEKMGWRIADNRVAEESDWDNEKLALEFEKLTGLDFKDIDALGFSADELANFKIDLPGEEAAAEKPAKEKKAREPKAKPSLAEHFDVPPTTVIDTNSKFWRRRQQADAGHDVLSELVLRWYCPADGAVCDPFGPVAPQGYVDLVFGHVEGFTGDFTAFIEDVKARLAAAVKHLKPARYLVLLVDDVRAANGLSFHLSSRVAEAAELAGVQLVDEAVVIGKPMPVPIEVPGNFASGRVLRRAHSTLLVYVHGDPKVAAAEMGPCECGAIEASDAQVVDPKDPDAGLAVA